MSLFLNSSLLFYIAIWTDVQLCLDYWPLGYVLKLESMSPQTLLCKPPLAGLSFLNFHFILGSSCWICAKRRLLWFFRSVWRELPLPPGTHTFKVVGNQTHYLATSILPLRYILVCESCNFNNVKFPDHELDIFSWLKP